MTILQSYLLQKMEINFIDFELGRLNLIANTRHEQYLQKLKIYRQIKRATLRKAKKVQNILAM